MAGYKLTEVRVRKAPAKPKPYKITDGYGLHLYITPAGKKYWR